MDTKHGFGTLPWETVTDYHMDTDRDRERDSAELLTSESD